eukprot:COSAG04_NODE_8068_length_1027_cov_1.447198_2_plen_102_part_00
MVVRHCAWLRVVGLLRRQTHAVLVQVHHQPGLDPRHELPAAPHLDRRPRSVMEAIEVKDFVVVVRAAELGVGALEWRGPRDIIVVGRPACAAPGHWRVNGG